MTNNKRKQILDTITALRQNGSSNLCQTAATLLEDLYREMDEPTEIKVDLPNGEIMRAVAFSSDANPAIDIYLGEDNEKILCFAEYNMDKAVGERVCICAYKEDQEDSVYYDSYKKVGSNND